MENVIVFNKSVKVHEFISEYGRKSLHVKVDKNAPCSTEDLIALKKELNTLFHGYRILLTR